MKKLKQIWLQLTSGYSSDHELIEQYWCEIEKAYTANGRHYHNFAHLQFMFELAFKHLESLNDKDTLMFSIFYHDIVYDTKRNDNEEKSAEVAGERLTALKIPPEKIKKCRQQIIATKNHLEQKDSDTNYLLDFDLAILGATPETYLEYSKQIREEYSIYPNFLYRRGRKKVLQHILKMDKIFKTSEFYQNCELQARVNLKTELSKL